MCLNDDFQGLGDKENMYGVRSVLPYKIIKSVNGWPTSKVNRTGQTQNVLRQVKILRRNYGYFTTKRLKVFAGVSADASDEKFRRVLRANGFKYIHSRKKGLLSRRDLEVRFKFAKQVRKRLQWRSQPDNLVMLCKFFCVCRL